MRDRNKEPWDVSQEEFFFLILSRAIKRNCGKLGRARLGLIAVSRIFPLAKVVEWTVYVERKVESR